MEYSIMRTDVLIIGSGLSGLMAAKRLREKEPDARITVLGDGWGASPFVHGFNMPLHPEDSTARFEDDTLRSGKYQSDPKLVKALCEGAETVRPILGEMGIAFDKAPDGSYKLLRPLGASVPRVASVGNHTGIAITKKIRAQFASDKNFERLPGMRALRLFDRDGRVLGALVYDKTKNTYCMILSRVTILAAGGFCNIYPFSTNKSDIGGDAVSMAYNAGAALTDLEFVQFEPSAAVAPKLLRGQSVITTMYYEGAVLKNAKGERFMLSYSDKGECVDKDVQAKCIYREIKEGRGTENGGVYFDATGVGREKLNEMYASYVKRYQNVGIDIATTPFEIAPAPHTSIGGVRIDEHCATGVEGLYVCGESAGGIHGANRAGGNAGLEILVFGTIAGDAAADYLASSEPASVCEGCCKKFLSRIAGGSAKIGEDELASMKAEMRSLLTNNLSVLRCEKELKEAEDKLGTMLKKLEDADRENLPPELLYKLLRLENDMTAAYLLALSADERKGSVGCHVRTDFPEETGERYRVIVRREGDGTSVERAAL